jgi:hypothetical protein
MLRLAWRLIFDVIRPRTSCTVVSIRGLHLRLSGTAYRADSSQAQCTNSTDSRRDGDYDFRQSRRRPCVGKSPGVSIPEIVLLRPIANLLEFLWMVSLNLGKDFP